MPSLRILITGGGTSGHISPALALIQTLRELHPETQFLYIGSRHGLEEKLVRAADIPFAAIQTGKLRRYLSAKNLVDQFRIPVGVSQSLKLVRRFKPDVVLATGGYVAVPPVIAASMCKVPVLIHEQTAQVGLANRINARFATRIALSWDDSLKSLPLKYRSKAWVAGNPLRPQIFGGEAEKAVEFFHLSPDSLPVLYVTGGSLGARVINRAVEAALPELVRFARIIHQCGEQANEAEPDLVRLQNAREALPENLRSRYAVTAFVRDELRHVFALASLVLGRAGAGTVNELCALGKPALYIPLEPTGGDEQNKNAKLCQARGAAEILPQGQTTGETLLNALRPLLQDPERLQKMGAAALPLARPNAAQEIAAEVLRLAQNA